MRTETKRHESEDVVFVLDIRKVMDNLSPKGRGELLKDLSDRGLIREGHIEVPAKYRLLRKYK